MKPAIKKLIRILLAVAALAVTAVLLGIVPVNAGAFRSPIENAVRDATGLNLSIVGPITLRLGATPGVTSGSIVLGDPAGDPLLVVESFSATIGLFPLLGGRIHLRDLSADGIQIDYCSPLPMLSSKADTDNAPPSVVVDAVDLEHITVRCGQPAQADKLWIEILRVHGSAPEGGPMQLEAVGSMSGIDVTLLATGGELNEFLGGTDSFPISLSLNSETTSIDVSGSLLTPLVDPAVDAKFEMHSSDLQSLSSAFGVSLPVLGALQADGRIRADLETVELVEFSGELGASRISLATTADLTGERAHLELTVMLEQFDIAPFLDNGPVARRADLAVETGDIDLRPVLDVLGVFDANVQLIIKRVLGAPLDVGTIEITASLADGIVELRPLAAEILGGDLSVNSSFDSQSPCPELRLRAHANKLDLARLHPLLMLDEPIGGRADSVDLETTSCGNSFLEHRDSLRAEIDLVGGRIILGDNPFPIAADRLHMSIAHDERGHARLIGKLAEEQVHVTLAVGSLTALLGPDAWPIDFKAQGAGGQLQINGRAGIMTGQVMLDAMLDFEAPQIGTLHSWTNGPHDAALPLRATTRLRFDESHLVADEIALSLGVSDLGGRAVWKHAEDPDILALTLRSANLDLDEIVAAVVATMGEPEGEPKSDADDDMPLIPVGFRLPPIDLDLEFDAVNFHQFDLQNFAVSGHLREGLIDEARVSVVVEDEITLRGNLDLDLRPSPAEGALNVAAENVDIGRLLRNLNVADDLQLRVDELELAVTTKGDTPVQFLLNALLDADMLGFSWHIPGDRLDTGEEPGKAFDLRLAQLSLTTGPEQRTTWSSHGVAAGVPLEVWMETPSLKETFGDVPELPLTLVAAAGNNVAMFEARVDRSAEQGFLAHVLLSGAVVEAETRKLAELQSPLPDYEVRSDVALTENELTLPNLQLRLGSTEASGSFRLTSSDERRRTDIALHAPYVQTDDLLYWTTDFREAAITNKQLDDEEEVEDQSERGVLFILKDYIAEFRESDDLDLSITVDELHAGTDFMGGAELGLYIDEDDFILKPLDIHLSGGDVVAAYTSKTVDGRLDAELRAHIEALRYGGLLRLVDPESQARGVLYLDTELSANTEWLPDATAFGLMLKNANGSFELAAWPENAEAGMLDLWTANLVLALLPKPTTGESKLMNCLLARLEVKDGVMQTGTALLDSTDTIIRGRGEIDLKQETLKLLVAPQAKREKFMSMSTPVMVTGGFDDFQIGVEPGGMFATAMKWWMSLVYVPFKWLTGERFPADGTPTCFNAMEWELTPALHEYFLQRDFSVPPPMAED